MKNLIKNFGAIIVSIILIVLLFSVGDSVEPKYEEVGIKTFIENISNNKVESAEVRGDYIYATLKGDEVDKKELKIKKESRQSFSELMTDYGVDAEVLRGLDVQIKDETGIAYWMRTFAPYILPFLMIGIVLFIMTRQMAGANNKAMGFGQSRAKELKPEDQKEKKTFKDVAGATEAKEELEEIIDFLRNPKRFTDMGAKIPKGVLLMGAPGTGKTLLAKAVAGEASVPFFHMSGSEFVEMFVGVGASRVRDLFSKATKSAPSIIFIDEIDAVGRKRGAGLGGGHDEREQTLNQILVEMDGFDPHIGVIVIAATNRPDVLDQALLRPGRFDRRVVIDRPDMKDRLAILEVHGIGKPLAPDVSLDKLAKRTPGFTGADLANLLNEAAILAVRRGKDTIHEVDILESIDKVLLGPEKRSRIMSDKEREMTAYHEAGHAVVGHFLEHADPVRKVSIIGRGMAGGYTLSMPEMDKRYQTMAEFKDDIAMAMGGYAAEVLIYGRDNLSTGPSSDLKKATSLARAMIMQYGMGKDLGPRVYGDNEEMIFLAQEIHDKKNYSNKTAEMIDSEIDGILLEGLHRAETTIKDKRDKLDSLVVALLKKETIEQEDFVKIMNGESLSDESKEEVK